MSFLDNLENSLKSLERAEERDGSAHQKRESERAAALAVAPWAEKLKTSPYTAELMNRAAEAGHRLRAKMYIAWLGVNLRFEIRDRKLELRPTSDGIQAVFLQGTDEQKSQVVDLNGNPADLIQEWLG
jgi:hypothetical protein